MGKLGICVNCKRDNISIICKDLCRTCYRNTNTIKGECFRCNKIKQLTGLTNMCRSCYETERISNRKEEKEQKYLYQKEYRERIENKEKERQRAKIRAKDPKNIEKNKQRYNKVKYKKYGITEETYNTEILKCCFICGDCNRLHVDHCHTTGLYRGILCGRCNNAIGLFDDDVKKLQNAINYLNNFNDKNRLL